MTGPLGWFLVGGLVVLWPLTVVVGVYAFWRYAYVPFRVMRADLVGLKTLVDEHRAWVTNELGLRKALAMTDEELAIAEGRMRARKIWHASGSG